MTNGDIQTWDTHWQKLSAGQKRMDKNPTHRGYFNELRRHLGSVQDLETLELGAGRATLSWFIAQNGGRPTALDTSETAKRLALANFKATHTGPLTYLTGDAANSGIADNSYDAVFSVGLLEHFENPSAVLDESARIAKRLAWHVVIEKTKGNDAFYRNDIPRDWYAEQGWKVKDWQQDNVFIVWRDL